MPPQGPESWDFAHTAMPTVANIHYFTNGDRSYDRPPVLLIHGSGGHHLYWPPQVRRLNSHRVFAMDLPGHGRSDGIGRDRTEDYVDDVLAFMAGVGLNSAVWIGHSMGGAIALHAALRQPRRVLALGMVASGARLRVDHTLLRLASREAAFPAALKLIGELAFSEAVDPRLKELALQRMAEVRPTVFHGDLVACEAFDQVAHLGEIRVPTLILCGSQDRITPLRDSEQLHSGIAGSEMVILHDAGHMVMLERPDDTALALGRFLDSVAYKPGDSTS